MISFPRTRPCLRSSSATAERTEHHPVILQNLRKPLTNLSLRPRRRADALRGHFGEMSEVGGVSARCWFHPQFNLFSGPQHPASLLFHSPISRVDSVNSQKTCFPPLSSVSRCLHACVAPQANTLAFFRRGPSVYRRAAAARELLAPRQTAALYLCSK